MRPDEEVLGHLAALADDAVALAHTWQERAAAGQTSAERRAGQRIADLVADAEGLAFAVRFVDEVARPEDPAAAATALQRLPRPRGSFLSPVDRLLLIAGQRLAPLLPRVVVPLARRRLRQLVGHLVVDARDPALARHLAQHRAAGSRPNVNLLGEAVLGEAEAAARAQAITALLERGDVDHVSVKVSTVASQLSVWDTAGSTARVVERLRPLFRAALDSPDPRCVGRYAGAGKFITIDMEEYKDLDLTLEVFEDLLARPEFHQLEAGVVLQAYLPDSVAALERLIRFAEHRHALGHAGFKIRLVKGANLAMESVVAETHGWERAPYATKEEVDANFLRLLDRILSPDVSPDLRVGVASHNLFDVAAAHLLAQRRDASYRLDVEMLQGMAPAQARVVAEDVGAMVLYTPVVAPRDFDVAVAYLVRRLEENAQPQNYLHAMVHDDGTSGSPMADQERRFRASVAAVASTSTTPRRAAGRPAVTEGFSTTPDSDPALADVRDWARDAISRSPGAPQEPLGTVEQVDAVVARAVAGSIAWAARPPSARARLLREAARALEAARADLIGAMAAEGGKTIDQADPEVSEAVDFARYYADAAEQLSPGSPMTDGARFIPPLVTLVTPPWNFPVAIGIGGVLAALAAGSAVIMKPAPQVPRCGEIAMAALHAAGIPDAVAQLVHVAEDEVGQHLVSHADVEVVVLTGAIETARMFESWRSDRPGGPRVHAETSGKNALVITPSADLDLAVADLVASAFGHAGQKCSAASLGILVGSVGTSEKFRRQLVDAVASLRVGWATDLGTGMGPLIEPPTGKLHRALTSLEPGERWLVTPTPLDQTGRLWGPGLKTGVRPGSYFHLTEVFGPVLGLMHAADLDEAIAWAGGTRFGLTGGLHSLDPEEIDRWRERVEVGNAYINRSTTGAIVGRQPFGGWKDSSVGPGAKAGGPNYVASLGRWESDGLPIAGRTPSALIRGTAARLSPLVGSEADQRWLEAAAASDAHALATALTDRDVTGLVAESNVLRYRPLPLLVLHCGQGTRPVAVARVLLAAAAVGTPVRVSTSVQFQGLNELSDLRVNPPLTEFLRTCPPGTRIRALGDAAPLRRLLTDANATVLDGPVLATGRIELLTVTREQSVSQTLHRFGHVPPDPESLS